MKEKNLKLSLIIIGIIPFLWIFGESLAKMISDSEYTISFYFMQLNLCVLTKPWVLLGIIPFFIGVLIPIRKLKKDKKNVAVKKNNKKLIWIVALIVGIIPLIIPLINGIKEAINGFTPFCILECKYIYGFEAFVVSIKMYSIMYGVTYIIGIALIFLSIIKLIKK